MGRASTIAFVAAIELLGAACATIEPPPIAVRREWGVARASTEAASRRLAEHVDAVLPAVRARVPGLPIRPVDVRFVAEMRDAPRFAKGTSTPFDLEGRAIRIHGERWIELGEREDALLERRVLVHELVHDGLGPEWDPLPHFIEEGLADEVGLSVVPVGSTAANLERVLLLATVLRGGLVTDAAGAPLGLGPAALLAHPGATLDVKLLDARAVPTVRGALHIASSREAFALDPATYVAMVAVGGLLVSRIGPARLRTSCLRANARHERVLPAEWLLDAAGLPSDTSDPAWERAVLELYGPLEQRLHSERARPKRR